MTYLAELATLLLTVAGAVFLIVAVSLLLSGGDDW